MSNDTTIAELQEIIKDSAGDEDKLMMKLVPFITRREHHAWNAGHAFAVKKAELYKQEFNGDEDKDNQKK